MLKEYLKKYVKYLKPFISYEAMIFIILGLSSLISLVNPLLFKVIIDRVLILKEVELLNYVIGIFVFFYIINILMSFCNGYLNLYVNQSIAKNIRNDLVNHLQKCKLNVLENIKVGDVVSKSIDDVGTVTGFMTDTIISIINNLTNVIITALVMFYFSWKLSLIGIFSVLIQTYISTRYAKKVKVNQEEIREKASVHISFLKQIMSSIKIIKAYSKEEANSEKYDSLLKKIIHLSYDRFLIIFKHSSFVSLVSFVSSMLIFIIAIYEIYKGNMTVGVFFVFDTLVERFNQFSGALINININIQNVMVAFGRIESIFNIKKEDDLSNETIEGSDIIVDNLSFKYEEDSDIDVIKNLTLQFKKGSKYAIIGESGEGKSTISNLLIRLYDIEKDKGNIIIGNKNIKNINIYKLRQKISVVFQESYLINGSIEENILYGNSNVEESHFQKILELCHIQDFIIQLPNGIQTIIGENGFNLSSGQKQRICIARSLLRNSDIYIFDESFSNLDKKLESKIYNNILKEFSEKTIIFIIHNLDLIKNMDNICVLKKGNMEAIGSSDELIRKSETYRELWERGKSIG
ncbi:ABC transporter ATP-binding protein [Vallitalea sediminicola]